MAQLSKRLNQGCLRLRACCSCLPCVQASWDKNHWSVPKGSRYVRINLNLNELQKKKKSMLCSVFIFIRNLVLVACKGLYSKILRFRSWPHIYTTNNSWPYEVISITLPLPQAEIILESSLNGSLSKEAICSFIKLLIILAWAGLKKLLKEAINNTKTISPLILWLFSSSTLST